MSGVYVQNNGEVVIYEMGSVWASSDNIPEPGEQSVTLGAPISDFVAGKGWSGTTATPANILPVGGTMDANRSYIPSPNGDYFLIMQDDSNLVFYKVVTGTLGEGQTVTANPLWASNTQGEGATQLTLTSDGQMNLNTTGGTTTIDSNVSGDMCGLYIQNDGNLVLYSQLKVWAPVSNS